MERNVRIDNLTNSKITLNFKDLNEKVYPIRPKGFVKITEEELSYLMNVSTAIKDGLIKVANEDVLTGDINKDELKSDNAFTDNDIVTLLKKPQKALAVELENITSLDVVNRILVKANELDKTVKIVELIESRVEQLMA